jgi:hypothetical protein
MHDDRAEPNEVKLTRNLLKKFDVDTIKEFIK